MPMNSRRLAALFPPVSPSNGPVRRLRSARRYSMFSGACLARSLRVAWVPALLLGGLVLVLPLAAQDKEPAGRDGLFITVPDPINDQAVTEIKRKLKAAADKKRTLDTVVFDFNPQNAPA